MEQLNSLLEERGLDGMLLTGGVAIRYVTGFTGDECFVLLTKCGCSLITDFRYTIQAGAQTRGRANVLEVNGREKQLAALAALLTDNGCKAVGFEDGAVTVAVFNELRELPVTWVPFSRETGKLRLVKSQEEIAALQTAQRMADAAFRRFLEGLHPGMTEREAAATLNYLCAMEGSEAPSFDPIIGSGENGAMCHAVPGERVLRRGDFVVIDFGCVYHGYHSDMTRTVAMGAADEEMRRVYAVTLEAQQTALSALKGGISGRALDGIARKVITDAGYGDCFGHGLGHGFGLEIHEPPRAGPGSEDVLLPGMTVTVEPGIYLPGKCGVRIEDCCVVTENGHLNLVSTAKDLLLV